MMKKKGSGIAFVRLTLVALMALAFVYSPAESATINVTASATDILAADGSCALREAITNINNGATTYADCAPASGAYGTNDTINLPAGTYTNAIAGLDNANAAGDLDILASVTINGAGAGATIIDGGAIDRVFQIFTAATVNISGVTIQNGSSSSGGGIYSYYGSVTVTNTTISGNTGGGITNTYGTLTVTNTTISGNTATNRGGGIDSYGTLAVTGSTISNNASAGHGGAGIYSNGTLTVTNTTIDSNNLTSLYSGGGIYLYSGTANVTGSTISNNTARYGGGIFNLYATLTVDSSTISGNIANTNGGGGIFNNGTGLTVTGSTISGNTATAGPGGGVYNGGPLTVTGSTISGNTASMGGGVYNAGTADVTNTTISNNTALYGGGIWHNGGAFTVTGSTIGSNSAVSGGGIYNYSGIINVGGTTINNNTVNDCAYRYAITDNGGNINHDGTCGFGPALISPTGVSPTSTPTYTWSAMASATQYQLWVDNSSGSGAIQDWVSATAAGCGGGVGTCSYTPATAVAYGTVTWWVRGYDPVNGLGSWGGPLVFTVQLGAPPATPAPVSPTGVIATSTPTYTWASVTGATWYQLWVSDSSGSGVIRDWVLATDAGCASGVGTCSYTSATAVAYGNVNFWVRGYNHSDGLGAWGGPLASTLQLGAPPATPAPISPTGASATSTPAYTWNAVAGAAWYQIWVNDSSGSGVIRDWVLATDAGCAGGVGTCSYTSATAVAPGNASWWVRGYNTADGASAWGGPMTFTAP